MLKIIKMSLTEIPEKFFGKYKLERSENFEEFLASKGVNWFLRKIISMSSITKGIEKSTEQPGRYNFINLSSKMNLQYKNVALGEIVFGMLNPETLSESHVRLNNPQDKGETYHYTVEGDYLVLAMDNEDIHCKLLAGTNASTRIPDKFLGTWELGRSENFDEYLKARGVNWFVRKMISMASVTKVFEKGSKPNTYSYSSHSSSEKVAYRDFTLAVEFAGKGFDGLDHLVGFKSVESRH
ncbi:hypothetical protein M3Y97_00249800 [Aphelenchoides bicaudatus]|nr:hypothetical protein M3Y97_00249800 [Aphelenchoides bicaudatus]